MTETRKDREWLKQQVTELFENEKGKDEPDNAVCAKLADLLLKMMPAQPEKEGDLSDNLRRLALRALEPQTPRPA